MMYKDVVFDNNNTKGELSYIEADILNATEAKLVSIQTRLL